MTLLTHLTYKINNDDLTGYAQKENRIINNVIWKPEIWCAFLNGPYCIQPDLSGINPGTKHCECEKCAHTVVHRSTCKLNTLQVARHQSSYALHRAEKERWLIH